MILMYNISMSENLQWTLNWALKIVTGFVIVPLSFAMSAWWPWWEAQNGFKRIFYGVIFFWPAKGLLRFAAPWWNDFNP